MQPVSTLPEDHDEQVEWFHRLAAMLKTRADDLISAETQGNLQVFVRLHLPGHEWPEEMDSAQLVQAVAGLRENESAWNRALQSAIIDADDRFRAGRAEEAVKALLEFAKGCPWRLFAEVATNQASHYTP